MSRKQNSISVTWSDHQHEKFIRLGGASWLRGAVERARMPPEEFSRKAKLTVRDAEIVALARSGEEYQAIGAKFNISSRSVRRVAKQAGIPPRKGARHGEPKAEVTDFALAKVWGRQGQVGQHQGGGM